MSRRHTDAITESVAELADLGLVKTASAQVRVHGAVPMFKLYILNRAEAFFGFYPIAEHPVTLHGEQVPMYDLMGKDVTLFHYETGDDPTGVGAQYVAQAQGWFDSMWHRQPPTSRDDHRPDPGDSIEEIVRRSAHVLLDFDGPVCCDLRRDHRPGHSRAVPHGAAPSTGQPAARGAGCRRPAGGLPPGRRPRAGRCRNSAANPDQAGDPGGPGGPGHSGLI